MNVWIVLGKYFLLFDCKNHYDLPIPWRLIAKYDMLDSISGLECQMQPTVDKFPSALDRCQPEPLLSFYTQESVKGSGERRKMILSEKIMELRKKKGWSQEELAEKFDISHSR